MYVLPKHNVQFSDSNYWDTFFEKRGCHPFEWYCSVAIWFINILTVLRVFSIYIALHYNTHTDISTDLIRIS